MGTSAETTRKALICRGVNDANCGGSLEDVEIGALAEAFRDLRHLEPDGARRVEDTDRPGEPYCPVSMPKSCRLLRVRHRGHIVGVVVRTFRGGSRGQPDGVISEASGNLSDRSNLHRFFEGGTIGWD